MRRLMLQTLLRLTIIITVLFAAPRPLVGCKCAGSYSVCNALSTDLVFAGRVVSIEPNLDPWDPSVRSRFTARFSEEEIEHLEGDTSVETFRKVREVYGELLPEPAKGRVLRSESREELERVLEATMKEGRKTVFKVVEVFRGTSGSTVEVWTDFSDCGVSFRENEYYLVYAHQSDRNRLEAGACSRTNRLSKAGEDLAYLYFMKHGGTATGRIYGFVTSSRRDLETPRFWDSVASPVVGLTVQLQFKDGRRHSYTDREGRFVFDGLEGGDYRLVVFSKRYPEDTKILAGPREIHVKAGECLSELLLVEK